MSYIHHFSALAAQHPHLAFAAAVLTGLFALGTVVHVATRPAFFSLRGKVVCITGGSSGIGKSIAAACIKKGAHVAIFARKLALLESAQKELAQIAAAQGKGQRVTIHTLDVTDEEAAKKALGEASAAHGGVVHAIICSAGTSQPCEFESTTGKDFGHLLSLNITGCRNAVHAALPHMTAAAGGRVVLVSSQAGQVGLYGYSAYSASKFGLAGLAQALSMELWHRGIAVSLCFPPDTDTPLLAEENKSKPTITRLLSDSSATVQPEAVAADVVAGMERWTYQISTGFDGWMLATLTAGMGPADSLATAAVQVATMGLWRLVGLLYVQHFYSVVAKHSPRARQPGAQGGKKEQ